MRWWGRKRRERERLACSSHFLLVAAQEQNFGDQFLHVYLQDGNPVAKLGCDGSRALSAALEQNVNIDRWITIAVRYDRYHPLEKKKRRKHAPYSVTSTADEVEGAEKMPVIFSLGIH